MAVKLMFLLRICLLLHILASAVNCVHSANSEEYIGSVDFGDNIYFDNDDDYDSSVQPGDWGKIVGGLNADISNFPYQVSLRINNAHFCGGAIISSKHIITAGHCVHGLPGNLINAYVGSSSSMLNGDSYNVTNVTMHPSYDSSKLNYDLALLEVEPMQLSSRVKPIQVTLQSNTLFGSMGTISGWGVQAETQWRPSAQLQSAQVPVLPEYLCRHVYKRYSYTDVMFCAGYMDGSKDACQGDSGGPFVVENQLVGVVSWGIGCARAAYPGVYTKLSHPAIRNFIREVTNL